MTAMTKGTAMKDKKKRAAGAPSTGTFPDNFSGTTFGVISNTMANLNTPSPNLHASINVRDVTDNLGNFMQVTTVGGANINSLAASSFPVADFVATALRSETAVTDGASIQAQPGVFVIPNVVGHGVPAIGIVLNFMAITNGNAFNGGTSSTTAVVNTAGLTVNVVDGNLANNPPVNAANTVIGIDTASITSQQEIIFQTTFTSSSKTLGSLTTLTSSASDITGGTALKKGSHYFKVIFT